jgi:hypothetical protein
MFSGFLKVLITKSGMSILLGFVTVFVANIQGQLGDIGNTITVGAAIAGAVGLAFRHAIQKVMELLASAGR